MEVGPLARVLMLYAKGHEQTRDLAHDGTQEAGSAVGRDVFHHGPDRGAHPGGQGHRRLDVDLVRQLMANITAGDVRTFNEKLWEPSTWPKHAKGVGFTEAPRGAFAHWIVIDDGKISNYQAVVPSTWNAGPRDPSGQRWPIRGLLKGPDAIRYEPAAGDPAHDPQLRSVSGLCGASGRSWRRGIAQSPRLLRPVW